MSLLKKFSACIARMSDRRDRMPLLLAKVIAICLAMITSLCLLQLLAPCGADAAGGAGSAAGFDFANDTEEINRENQIRDMVWLESELKELQKEWWSFGSCIQNREFFKLEECGSKLDKYAAHRIDASKGPAKYSGDAERKAILNDSKIFDEIKGDFDVFLSSYFDFRKGKSKQIVEDQRYIRRTWDWSKDCLEKNYLPYLYGIVRALELYSEKKSQEYEARHYPEHFGNLTLYFKVVGQNEVLVPWGKGNFLVDMDNVRKAWKKSRWKDKEERLAEYYGKLEELKGLCENFKATVKTLSPVYQKYGGSIAINYEGMVVAMLKRLEDEYGVKLGELTDHNKTFSKMIRFEIDNAGAFNRFGKEADSYQDAPYLAFRKIKNSHRVR